MPYPKKTLTPKRRERRRRQLRRLGYDNDRILDILEYEFDPTFQLGLAPGTPLPSKKYKKGGIVDIQPEFSELRNVIKESYKYFGNIPKKDRGRGMGKAVKKYRNNPINTRIF